MGKFKPKITNFGDFGGCKLKVTMVIFGTRVRARQFDPPRQIW